MLQIRIFSFIIGLILLFFGIYSKVVNDFNISENLFLDIRLLDNSETTNQFGDWSFNAKSSLNKDLDINSQIIISKFWHKSANPNNEFPVGILISSYDFENNRLNVSSIKTKIGCNGIINEFDEIRNAYLQTGSFYEDLKNVDYDTISIKRDRDLLIDGIFDNDEFKGLKPSLLILLEMPDSVKNPNRIFSSFVVTLELNLILESEINRKPTQNGIVRLKHGLNVNEYTYSGIDTTIWSNTNVKQVILHTLLREDQKVQRESSLEFLFKSDVLSPESKIGWQSLYLLKNGSDNITLFMKGNTWISYLASLFELQFIIIGLVGIKTLIALYNKYLR